MAHFIDFMSHKRISGFFMSHKKTSRDVYGSRKLAAMKVSKPIGEFLLYNPFSKLTSKSQNLVNLVYESPDS